MKRWIRTLTVVAGATVLVTAAFAQSVISARSGVIHYLEGQAFLDDKPVAAKFGQFPEIKPNTVFHTEDGRSEILLTPGVFLRLGENSSVRMLDNKLASTRVEVLKGSALVECAEVLKDTAVTMVYKDKSIQLQKKGLFRIDTDPAQLKVFSGEAAVLSAAGSTTVKDGRLLGLEGVQLISQKFNKEEGDDLYRWAKRRAGYLAMANVSAARSVANGNSFTSGSWNSSGWMWNPYFGMFTYLPYRGFYNSPFGYRFFSPYTIHQVYERPVMNYGNIAGGSGGFNEASSSPHYDSNLGYTVASRSMGDVRSSATPSAIASPAASTSSPRTSDSAAPRSGGTSSGRR